MSYRLNGQLLEGNNINSLKPSRHSTTPANVPSHDTIGGSISVEPVGGLGRTFNWHYEQRSDGAIYTLFNP